MRRDLLWPLLLIISAFVLTGIVAYFVVASEEEGPATRLFKFRVQGKLTNFGIFERAISEDQRVHASVVVKLSLSLLESSIETNKRMEQGHRFQKYNYAVTETGDIVVAVWAERHNYAHLFTQVADSASCVNDGDWPVAETSLSDQPPDGAVQPLMINIYPEFQNIRVSPCWVTLPSGERTGLLDGSSKHLMLAQGPQVSLHDFSKDWSDIKVMGAGEIIVDLRAEHCAYTITDGSGTYRPYDLDNLRAVAFMFARSLRQDDGDPVPPEYVKDNGEGLLTFVWDSTLRENEEPGALTCL